MTARKKWPVESDIYVLFRDGYYSAARRLKEYAARDKAKLLVTDGCGDAYCPNCGTWMSEYHPKYSNMLDERPQNYCENCGQRLVWKIEEAAINDDND